MVGLVALVTLVFIKAPAWAHSLFLLLWCLVWGTWLARNPSGLEVESFPPEVVTPAVLASDDEPDVEDDAPLAVSANDSKLEPDPEVLRYALSHDLRAPLRVVDGFTRILKEDYGRVLDKVGNDHLERVLAASARMNGMIDAILAQAQLARAPLERREIDLSALAREVAGELSGLHRDANGGRSQLTDFGCAEFVVADGLLADGDPTLVRRVLENLMGNALKYSAKVAQPRIEVGLMPATNPAVFFVRDNGVGFDMQHANKLFGLFQRLHSAKEFPGSGVGLAGVQNIIARHGGRVWAEAQAGQGACFYFTLISAAQAQQKAFRVSGASGTDVDSGQRAQA
ncbi:MAG: hypothetical protein KGL90_01595 [Burkholderiales bacterium]|nr:hypothetical protein [Burkholderiales bacterium]